MSEFSTLNGYKVKDKKAVRFYDTVADMKVDTTLKDGMHVKTKGYYSINDDGGAEYHITTIESETEYQETLNNNLYATLLIEDVMNIKQFGAYGDGETDDTTSLQNAINISNHVFIPDGVYCISTSLKVKTNLIIEGNNVLSSIIKAIDDISIFENNTSANYLTIKNLKLETEETSTKYAINIEGSTTSPYTGATYSLFENIYIDGFDSGIFLNHIWNTSLNKIRVKNGTTNGIFLGGGCNNVEINMPIIESIVNGIRLTTSDIDSTQNTNITINKPDLEYCQKGIYLYNDETIAINNIYSEHNTLVVYAFGTKGLKIDGFYSSFDTKFGEIISSKAKISNGFIRLNSNDDIGIISSSEYIDINNISGANNGTGKIFNIANDVNSYIPLIYSTLPYNIESESFRLRYSSDNYSGVFNSNENNGNQYSCFKPCLVITSNNLVASSGDQIQLKRNGVTVATLSINNGASLNKNDILEFTASNTNAKNFIYQNGDTYEIKHTSTTGVDVSFKMVFRNIKTGKFIIN